MIYPSHVWLNTVSCAIDNVMVINDTVKPCSVKIKTITSSFRNICINKPPLPTDVFDDVNTFISCINTTDRRTTLESRATVCLVSSKITMVGDITILRDAGHKIVRYNFLLYQNALWVFSQVTNVLPYFSFMFENTENIPLTNGECCMQCVLVQWVHHEDSSWLRAQTRLKNVAYIEAPYWYAILSVADLSYCFYMLTVLALVCCRHPNNVHFFKTIFRNISHFCSRIPKIYH